MLNKEKNQLRNLANVKTISTHREEPVIHISYGYNDYTVINFKDIKERNRHFKNIVRKLKPLYINNI